MSEQRTFAWLLAAVTSLLLLSCGDDDTPAAEPAPEASPPPPGLLATVNGTPITEADVRVRLGVGGSRLEEEEGETEIPPERMRGVLETLIREEVTHQRALELGLDDDPAYRERLDIMEARVRDFSRRELGQAFFRQEIQGGAEVTEEEVRAHFDAHAAELRTERHIQQILKRDQTAIREVHRALAGGTPFEEVAAQQFPGLTPETPPPWDLGFLRWEQLPEPWREVLPGMSVGETSGVIEGPSGRFWIIHLVEERENPEVDFESSRTTLTNALMATKIEHRRLRIARELRRAASIEYAEGGAGDQGGEPGAPEPGAAEPGAGE